MPNLWESVAVAFVAVVGGQILRTYLGKKRIRSDFDYAMQVVAKEAVRQAKNEYKVDLDLSADSIERVEEILTKMHEGHVKNPLAGKELSLRSIRWGAYIGEVAKRVRLGKWRRDSEKLGRNTMPLVFDSANEAFPCSWAYKRIADGPDDNVLLKFRCLTDLELRKHLGSTQAVIADERSKQKE